MATQGIINLVNNSNNPILYDTIGSTQIAAAVIAPLAALTSYPYILNIIYKYQDGGFKGKLLPSSYSDEEISIQSHLIALLCIVINKEKNISQLLKGPYIRKVRKFILSQFEAEGKALSGHLSDSNKLFLNWGAENQ